MHKRTLRLQALGAQLVLGIAGLALITFVCFWLGLGLARTGFAYVIVIALSSLLGSFSASVVLSIVAAACLNYFFAPPLFDLRIDVPEDIERIAAFLTTSLVAAGLTTRRRRVEEELSESRSRLEEAQRLAHVGWWERDLITGRVTVSDEVSRILGARPVARWLDLIHPEDRSRAAEAADAAIRPGGPRYDLEYRVVRPDGTLRVVHSQADATWDASGRPPRQFGVLQDVTELRQAEKELRASEARFRGFVDNAADAFLLLDNDWTVLDVNRQACHGLGYSREELIGKHKSDFDVGLDLASIQRLKQRMIAGEAFTFETCHRRKDGTSFPVEIRVGQFEQDGRRYLCLARDITGRKQAEEALRDSEARFRTFVDRATDAFFLLDDESTVLDVNRQACDSLGYTREELIGKHRSDFDIGLDEGSIRSLKERTVAGEAITFETRHRRKDGTSFPVEIRVGQFEQDGHRFLCLARDISERKRAEDALRESEERFRSFVDHATDGFFLLDEHQALVDVNRQACESLGYRREELIGMHPRDFDSGLDAASIARIGERVTSGETVTFQTRHRRKDGTVFPVEVRARQFRHGAHRFRLSLARDITERERAEEVLRESEVKLQKAQRIAHFGWWERDFTTKHVSLSDQVCRIFGLQPVDLPQWHARWLELIHPEDRPRAAEAAAAALRPDGPRYDVEYRVIRPDGTERVIHSQGDVTWDEAGRPQRQFGVLQDITELRRAEKGLRASEEALRRSEAYLAEAQRLSHTGTFAFNATAPVYWSDESYRIWALDPRQGLPARETVSERVHPDDRERVNAEIDEALRQKTGFALEFRIVLPDGTAKYIESTGHPLLSADGEVVEMIATHVDVTERKRAQEERERLRQLEADLAHLNRVSMMGELAASLAHEILHPIATARNNARAGMRFLERSPPDLGEVGEALACIVRDADRAKDIVSRMRDHIKKAPPRREPFDLNEAINEVVVTARSTIASNRVSVRTRLMELRPVLGDRVQLQQVVMNLILNAVEAMSPVVDGARELSIATEQSQTGGAVVAVRDCGPGIDPGQLERVFEPFYTTKAGGIGMGLSICRSIIAAHGGRLWAQPNRPRGTIFQFTLPAGVEAPPEANPPASHPPAG
jgi:PAS domain S-box-containing protein